MESQGQNEAAAGRWVSMNITFLVMSSTRLPWRMAAIDATWKRTLGPWDVLRYSRSNTTYYGAQRDHFDLLRDAPSTDADWTCLVDDDTFVNVPMMRRLLSQYDANKPVLVGHVLTRFHCLWGGAGMLLSRAAHARVLGAIRNGHLRAPTRGGRNDVEVVKWAEKLRIHVVHSNLLWGDSVPEVLAYLKASNHNRKAITAALQGTATLHKMCDATGCPLMHETLHLIHAAPTFYSV